MKIKKILKIACGIIALVSGQHTMMNGQQAMAQSVEIRFKNEVAVFSGIDKITARITTFSVPMNETVEFGKLQITPRVCYTAAKNRRPKTTAFVEVDSLTLQPDAETIERQRIFTGWMFAQSPGINAIEHTVNDVWLINCEGAKQSTSN